MNNHIQQILDEFESLKGQFILNHNKVERFIGIVQDDEDIYYATYDGRKVLFTSCLISLIPLKGKLDDKHYNEFIRLAKLNDFDQANLWGHDENEIMPEYVSKENITYKEFAKRNRESVEKLNPPDKYLTEVCWDLN